MTRVAAKAFAVLVMTLVVTGAECAAYCPVKACQPKAPPCHRHQKQPASPSQGCAVETAAVQPPAAPVSVDPVAQTVAIAAPDMVLAAGVIHRPAVLSPPEPDLLSSTILRI
jgi:hypothetical protein